jgi:hypothetical protein
MAVGCLTGYLILNTTSPPSPSEPRLVFQEILRQRGHYTAGLFLLAGLVPWVLGGLEKHEGERADNTGQPPGQRPAR